MTENKKTSTSNAKKQQKSAENVEKSTKTNTKTTQKHKKRENKRIVVTSLVIIATVFATFVTVAVLNAPKTRTSGSIVQNGTLRSGTQGTLVYQLDKPLERGANVSWYVNDRKVLSSTYDGSGQIKLDFTPSKSGTNTVTVRAGNYTNYKTVVVKKPVLEVTPNDVTVVYGETLPQLTCTATSGGQTIDCDYTAYVTNYPANVGTYNVYVKPHASSEYDVVYKTGKVTVVPRMLALDQVTAVYNGTDEIDVQSLGFTNVAGDDEIEVCTDYIKLPSKNVGFYNVSTKTLEIDGDKANNYVLPSVLTCEITPKKLQLTGIEAYDKVCDGTTLATVKNAGTLCGVESGDNVALGSLTLRFDGANVGTHGVIVENVTVVGMDKQNYLLDGVETHSAVIN